MKRKKLILLVITIVSLIIFTILGYIVANELHKQRLAEVTYEKAKLVLSEQELKTKSAFSTNKNIFQNIVDEIERLPSSVTDLTINNGEIQSIKIEGIRYEKQQSINSISEQLSKSVLQLKSAGIQVVINKDSSERTISFITFYGVDQACFYSVKLVYSKDESYKAQHNEEKVSDNWYLIKSINWGT